MKRLLIAVFAVCALSAASFAGGWGLGVKLGAGQNDPKTLKDANIPGTTLDESPAVFALEGLYEWDLEGATLDEVGSVNKLGLRFGIEGYGENELKYPGGSLKEETSALPITVYYKRDGGIQAPSYYIGGGLTYIMTTVSETGFSDEDKNKVFPHIMAGAEYRFTKLFALGLDLKYNIGAKVKKNGAVFSDRSGLQGTLAARFYF